MTEQDVEMAMESLFVGASRVRAEKYARKLPRGVHRQFSSRVAAELWNHEKRQLKASWLVKV